MTTIELRFGTPELFREFLNDYLGSTKTSMSIDSVKEKDGVFAITGTGYELFQLGYEWHLFIASVANEI